MENFILILNIILAVILIGVILLQRSEGGALGLGVSQDNFISSRSASSFLTKTTAIIDTLFIITSISLTIISKEEISSTSVLEKVEEEKDSSEPEIPKSDAIVANINEAEKVIDNDEYIKVKVLETLPTFTGMDANNYTLKNEDITEIPIYNAKILRDAGKVEIMKEVN